MLSVAKVGISAQYDNEMTIFLSRKQGFLGLSQRFDIKQGSGITGMILLPTI